MAKVNMVTAYEFDGMIFADRLDAVKAANRQEFITFLEQKSPASLSDCEEWSDFLWEHRETILQFLDGDPDA